MHAHPTILIRVSMSIANVALVVHEEVMHEEVSDACDVTGVGIRCGSDGHVPG